MSPKPINAYNQDKLALRLLGFESEGRALLYSGGVIGVFSNWDLAENYAQKHDMVPVELTQAGIYLAMPDRYTHPDYEKNLADSIWKLASRKYARQAKGDIKTLVCCSNQESVFRSSEMDRLLLNPKINTINGLPRQALLDYRQKTFLRLRSEGEMGGSAIEHARFKTYHKIALQELRVDFERAKATGDMALEKSASLRFNQQRLHFKSELKEHHEAAADARRRFGKVGPAGGAGSPTI